jgi:hypothetical protein
MNAAELFRLRLSSLLSRGLSSSRIASAVGLAAASEVWGGDAPRDAPAWYVWLRGAAGAWQLELAAAEPLRAAAGGKALVGTLAVRCFPARAAPELRGFSQEERAFAATRFDRTGTPRIDAAAAMPASFFAVGAIEWAVDEASGASVLTLSALDRARTRSASARAGRRAIVRDVPAWTLALPLFTAIAGLHSQVDRMTATRLVVTSQPGFEIVEDGERSEAHETTEARQGDGHLVLAPSGDPAAGAALLDAIRDPGAATLLDRSLGACERGLSSPRGAFRIAVRDAWFGGSAHLADRAACAC